MRESAWACAALWGVPLLLLAPSPHGCAADEAAHTGPDQQKILLGNRDDQGVYSTKDGGGGVGANLGIHTECRALKLPIIPGSGMVQGAIIGRSC